MVKVIDFLNFLRGMETFATVGLENPDGDLPKLP